ncbi:MAG: aldo/keto reductase [Edaphobacter sp.]|uniref:aldo/keto reductase n=1 Tax=Edaphobacter sp. TaxID=1934404 RepID=UPI002399A2CD|nr:aldo/keto reductase [Edaphobacter sp.]MDE1176930.1 aldo/keto reductase [Edaphobacter sp.]
MKRREFLAAGAAAGLVATARGEGGATRATSISTSTPASTSNDIAKIPRITAATAGEMRDEMLYRKLGATGEEVSAIGMGGAHLGGRNMTDAEAIKLMHEAIDRGITFMDNCWDYNEGRSETRMGDALAQSGYRQKAFLMTKIDGRTKQLAAQQIEESLRRLKTDRIDLMQHHEVLRFDDPDRIFAEGGAMEALVEAKKAGKIRFIGFTGHKDPRVHLYMLDVAKQHGFHFDTLQCPINVMDAHYRSFSQMVVPRAMEDKVAVLGMKSIGSGILLKSGVVTAPECLHYSLNLPVAVQITGIDSKKVLDQAFAVVKNFKPMPNAEFATLVGKTRDVAMEGKYELFKTSTTFDGTVKHPEWLGGDVDAVKRILAS